MEGCNWKTQLKVKLRKKREPIINVNCYKEITNGSN
jgi:hypothetical protein